MALVHYGFSREEAYNMPIQEYLDYLQIIKDNQQEEYDMLRAKNTKTDGGINDLKFAGTEVM